MKRNRNPIVKVLESVLIPLGFCREGLTWYNAAQETVRLVNLQKSDWGAQYYVNLAAWILELGVARHPPERKCHVRVRLSSLVSDSEALDEALDLENVSLAAEERAARLKSDLERCATPVLLAMRSVPEIRAWLDTTGARGVVLTGAAREILRPVPEQQPRSQS